MAKEDKLKALDAAIAQIEKQYGKPPAITVMVKSLFTM